MSEGEIMLAFAKVSLVLPCIVTAIDKYFSIFIESHEGCTTQ